LVANVMICKYCKFLLRVLPTTHFPPILNNLAANLF
jgi:hypothetical protein